MTDPVVKFEQDGLCIQLSRAPDELTVSWLGVSDSRTPAAFLNPVIEQIARSAGGAPVTVDFTRLEYMNSATVTPLIALVRSLDQAKSPVLLLFAEVDWQRTHLQCMKAISRTLQNVRVEGRPPPV
jgi:anti-anti-sigma regulatory factor